MPIPLLYVVSISLALLYLAGMPRGSNWSRAMVKAGSVLLLAAIAFARSGPIMLVVALLLGAIGDAFLVYPGKKAFLSGLVAFLAAHLAYAGLFWPAEGLAALDMQAHPLRLVMSLFLAAITVLFLRLIWQGAASLQKPVLIYGCAILAMTISALASGSLAIVAGALLFFASDAVLALNRFNRVDDAFLQKIAGLFVWASYFSAQLIFTLAVP